MGISKWVADEGMDSGDVFVWRLMRGREMDQLWQLTGILAW
jgi:hypothetical protein